MIRLVTGHWSLVTGGTGRPWRAAAAVAFVVAALVAPIFAHGCHGGDDDHEPLFAPRAEEKK